MPPAILSREQVVERVMAVVRQAGYDGASLSELSRATGLGKSSLYHHFPEGKDDMVGAVLDHLEATLERTMLAPLRAPGEPATRLRQMNRVLMAFYRDGREACVLASLGIGDSSRRFHPRVKALFTAWIAAIALVLREGALVLARSLGHTAVFGRTLKALPAELLRR